LIVLNIVGILPVWVNLIEIPFYCLLMGGIGGLIYCLRGVYYNKCVKKNWDPEWNTWYYLRPIVSSICGGISYIFLKAGLLVLESQQYPNSTNLGFLGLAFITGFNVDKFLEKIEDIAHSTWGIKTTKMSNKDNK
jgi:hypothetical protein